MSKYIIISKIRLLYELITVIGGFAIFLGLIPTIGFVPSFCILMIWIWTMASCMYEIA